MKKLLSATLLAIVALTGHAQKRVNNHMYNPDPAPVVSGDRLYVFTGHDLDTATYFRMPDWQVFSTTDMEHWTDHGIVLSTANFKWAKQGDNAWASQAIERNGKWYWYVAAEDTTKHLHGIGVAVADRPEGPWQDALGKPLIPGDWGFIDPTVFIDDDGQAWLFWGNNGCWYAKLNEDMISIDKSFANNGICDMRAMLDDEAQFGPKCLKMDYQLHKKVMKTGFEEAPWIYKIGDTYFLEYAAGGVPEHWAYSTAKNIHGPWHYEGRITDESPGSFTIHGGTIDFKGKSYLFYHDGIPSGGNGFRRTTAFREFKRMKDGRIPKIDITRSASAQTQDVLEIVFPTGTEGFVEVYDVAKELCDTFPIVNGRMEMTQSNLPKTLRLKYMKERLDSNKVWISINQRDIRRGDLIIGHGHTVLTIDSLSSRRILGNLEDEFGDFEACHQYWRDRQHFRSEDFLKAHSQSVWALYHLDLDWDANTLQKALNCFSESLRNSDRGKKLQQLILDRKSKTGVAKLFPMWDTAGKAHSFEECMGDKDYMLLNLWASWCGPCRAEIPDLIAYYEECRERVAFVSVTVDEKCDAWLKAVEAEPKYEWPNLASKFDGTPKGRTLPLLFNPGYIPFFFILDRHGNTVYSSLEQKTDDRPLDDAMRRLNELLTK